MAVMDQPETIQIPDALFRDLAGSDSVWTVILFNDDVHTFDDVAFQLVKAIRCTVDEGYSFAQEVDATGSARVFEGDLESCERVATVLEEIHLLVKLQVQ